MFYSAFTLFSTVITTLLLTTSPSFAAFTLPIKSGNDTVERNSAGTWCYYPSLNTSTPLDPACTGTKADFRSVMDLHLRQPRSINYYSASLSLLGSTEFPVISSPGKVYLCMSGQEDESGRYKTICEVAERDNDFGLVEGAEGNDGKVVCAVEIGQKNVTDGCYFPVGSQQEESGSLGRGLSLYDLTPPFLVILSLYFGCLS
ncbi:hypothetical protein FA15DRAFT_628681 [Coprinopsis marcescibilis]|uniref:Uncharacterized protein n=1 Tax=Coprinopsis marcescibilis TaxID=230819 RepID=A0A5C3KCF9_COPMA|nr:hypothetical protein FA15DRAFT_628681 [Coprinopsis marcescibilis]